jgi:hypothetical protein
MYNEHKVIAETKYPVEAVSRGQKEGDVGNEHDSDTIIGRVVE